MNEWHSLGSVTDFKDGGVTPATIDDEEVVIVRCGDQLACFKDQCSHQDVKLSEFGEVVDKELVCYAHGARFQCMTGQVLGAPAFAPLERYELRVENGVVSVCI